MQQQSENFAKQIVDLQHQLAETTNIIKLHECSSAQNDTSEADGAKDQAGTDGSILKETVCDSKTVLSLETDCSSAAGFSSLSELNIPDEAKTLISTYVQSKLNELSSAHKEDVKDLKV